MTLEALANELLLDVFEYFDVVARFRAFYGLNSRFNALLLTYSRDYRLDTQSAFQHRSNIHFQQYLRSIIDRIISLRVSYNKDESSPQTAFFISFGIQLNQFIHLQSLSLCYINDRQILQKIMTDCQDLSDLTYLKVVKCHSEYMGSIDFSNIIWSLPKLTHCHLDMHSYIGIPRKVSPSIKYLSMSSEFWWLWSRDVIPLLQKTPYLHRLHMSLNNLSDYNQFTPPSFLSITMLKLSGVRSLDTMITILKAVPNLTYLKVDTHDIVYDGYQWERIIDHHLLKLKIFRLRMHIQFCGEKNKQRHVDQLVKSFRTRFWLEKHQWFIHCHGTLRDDYTSILLHTVPYTFIGDFDLEIIAMTPKSGSCQDIDYRLSDTVQNLHNESFYSTDWSFIECFNIRNLSIHFPVNEQFWKSIPTLNQLKSLTLLMADENAPVRLQSLLDRAPNLYSLTIKSWPDSQIPLVENISASLRRLDLERCRKWPGRPFFSREECNIFIRSPLAMKCEELLIQLQTYENVLDLINGMHNLRLLQIASVLDTKSNYDYTLYQKEGDEVINWVQHELPATYTVSNFKRLGNGITLLICSKEQ